MPKTEKLRGRILPLCFERGLFFIIIALMLKQG